MRRALGKGLAQLLGEQVDVMPTESGAVQELELRRLIPNPDQPRKNFDPDGLEELAESIRQVGLLQPILVRAIAGGQYVIIAGERRFRASQLAGLLKVPVLVREAEDLTALQLALIENVQREDLSPLEGARAFRELTERFGLTQEQVAEKVGKSRAAVANALRLLRLPEAILDALSAGLITEGHARALLQCSSERQLAALFERIVDDGLSVRETERLARATEPTDRAPRKGSTRAKTPADNATDVAWVDALSTYLGAPVVVERAERGGKIEIEFYDDDDLERVLEILGLRL